MVGEGVIVGVTVIIAVTEAEIEDEEVMVAATDRVREELIDSEGGIPIVPAKL